ncbi:MAG: hypothetical protein HZB39_00855 [Planctomycetes bacterium]|nr:hypothetical protein [Planctomycetota bacterium]
MNLDELKMVWSAHGALLERSLAIDERILREMVLRKLRRSLRPFVLVRALEVLFGVTALAVVVPLLVAHLEEPRYLVAGGALAVVLVSFTACAAQLLVHGARLDHSGPVTRLQRDLEQLRRLEYRALKWSLLGGVLCWLPGLMLLVEFVTGIPALARVQPAWLEANLIFGLALCVLGRHASNRWLEREPRGPFARRVLDALSGRSVRAAARHLDELARFVREDARAD